MCGGGKGGILGGIPPGPGGIFGAENGGMFGGMLGAMRVLVGNICRTFRLTYDLLDP